MTEWLQMLCLNGHAQSAGLWPHGYSPLGMLPNDPKSQDKQHLLPLKSQKQMGKKSLQFPSMGLYLEKMQWKKWADLLGFKDVCIHRVFTQNHKTLSLIWNKPENKMLDLFSYKSLYLKSCVQCLMLLFFSIGWMQLKAGPNKDHTSEGNNKNCAFENKHYSHIKPVGLAKKAELERCVAILIIQWESNSDLKRPFLQGESILVG